MRVNVSRAGVWALVGLCLACSTATEEDARPKPVKADEASDSAPTRDGQIGDGQIAARMPVRGLEATVRAMSGALAYRVASEPYPTDSFGAREENDFRRAGNDPLSTFSIDVDTASYSLVRRMIRERRSPPVGAVRIEELVNYFPYRYPEPADGRPFSVTTEIAAAPWTPAHRLLRIGLRAKSIEARERAPDNLVFLIDVSGSMQSADKLQLLIQSMNLLVDQLERKDRVAIVVYAGSTGLVLPPTSGDRRGEIREALGRLSAGGSTNGGAGIEQAYASARASFVVGGNNRVILCTDGDFNVGMSNQSDLVERIEQHAKEDIFLSVLGFGLGNLKDDTMERLADRGNGNHAYIDSLAEAHKVLVEQAGGTLVTVAKDVKIQVEWNPAQVAAYRLIGYENRLLAAQDFNDDKKDAGEIGAGHTVTALYEVIPVGSTESLPSTDPLKYQPGRVPLADTVSREMCTVKLRYKEPQGVESVVFDVPVADAGTSFEAASPDFQFAASVASFGMLLGHSKYAGAASLDAVVAIARRNVGDDPFGYRREFAELAGEARVLDAACE